MRTDRMNGNVKTDAMLLDFLYRKTACVYLVDAQTAAYECCRESEAYKALCLEPCGNDFFRKAEKQIGRIIHAEDRLRVRGMLSRKNLLACLKQQEDLSCSFRLLMEGVPVLHCLRASIGQADEKKYLLIEISAVGPEAVYPARKEKAVPPALSGKLKRFEEILASPDGYLSANLSKNRMQEIPPDMDLSMLHGSLRYPPASEADALSYSRFIDWHAEQVLSMDRERFLQLCSRSRLLRAFAEGTAQVSGLFQEKSEADQPASRKITFFIYRDPFSEDILCRFISVPRGK